MEKTELVMNPIKLEALSDLKLLADGPLRFRAIHLWVEVLPYATNEVGAFWEKVTRITTAASRTRIEFKREFGDKEIESKSFPVLRA